MKDFKIFVERNDQWQYFAKVTALNEQFAMDYVRRVYEKQLEELTGNKIDLVNLEWEDISNEQN